jgi:hypothetical protein
MMELLKRFEEEAAQDEYALHKEVMEGSEDGEVERQDTLVERFAGFDLGMQASISSRFYLTSTPDDLSEEDMWEMLTLEEREKFVKAVEDPVSELAQRLLRSEQLDVAIEQPWWTTEAEGLDHETDAQEQNGRKKMDLRPSPICIPQSMVKPVPSGHPLVYNMLAIWYVGSPTPHQLSLI